MKTPWFSPHANGGLALNHRPQLILTRRGSANTEEQFDAVVARQALARRLVPEDTAAAVGFLASDGGAAMTGQVLCVDGGVVMR